MQNRLFKYIYFNAVYVISLSGEGRLPTARGRGFFLTNHP